MTRPLPIEHVGQFGGLGRIKYASEIFTSQN
jgi:hypothetical protein